MLLILFLAILVQVKSFRVNMSQKHQNTEITQAYGLADDEDQSKFFLTSESEEQAGGKNSTSIFSCKSAYQGIKGQAKSQALIQLCNICNLKQVYELTATNWIEIDLPV